ncbi:hypothetical protein P879_01853 [Paragonimus westermani]|uniref:Uncharacterized protein n=1 Tax=Paragonimus westermani TaxID=34504 RepID=A0A8T0DZI5_9TREM|nr:hypothetical protein P879_01853 [Paragonimus westermani]
MGRQISQSKRRCLLWLERPGDIVCRAHGIALALLRPSRSYGSYLGNISDLSSLRFQNSQSSRFCVDRVMCDVPKSILPCPMSVMDCSTDCEQHRRSLNFTQSSLLHMDEDMDVVVKGATRGPPHMAGLKAHGTLRGPSNCFGHVSIPLCGLMVVASPGIQVSDLRWSGNAVYRSVDAKRARP